MSIASAELGGEEQGSDLFGGQLITAGMLAGVDGDGMVVGNEPDPLVGEEAVDESGLDGELIEAVDRPHVDVAGRPGNAAIERMDGAVAVGVAGLEPASLSCLTMNASSTTIDCVRYCLHLITR